MDINNNTSNMKDAFLPVHTIMKDKAGHILNQKSNVFQINDGEYYNISYKLFLPKGYHLASDCKPSYNCHLVNGKLNIPQITFTYVKGVKINGNPTSVVKRAPRPIVVNYFDIKNGKTIKKFDTLSGKMNQKINVLDHVTLPKGYTLQKASKINATISDKIQAVSLFFVKNDKSAANHAIQNKQPAADNNANHATPSNNPNPVYNIDQVSKILHRRLNVYNQSLSHKLLAQVDQHDGKTYQKVIASVLNKLNYQNVNTIKLDETNHLLSGLVGENKKTYLRARKYPADQKVTVTEMREFVTSIMDNNANKGLFITTSSFNPDAEKEAKRHHITTIDRNELAQLMMHFHIGLKVWLVYKINKVDKSFF